MKIAFYEGMYLCIRVDRLDGYPRESGVLVVVVDDV